MSVSFSKFNTLLSVAKNGNPLSFWILGLLPLVFVALFSVGPEFSKRYLSFRRERLSISTNMDGAATSDFRLDPYVTSDVELFS